MKAVIQEICVGKPKEIKVNGELAMTGIYKSAVEGPVNLSLTNLEGDEQANQEVHGGRDKAVYVYSSLHYPFWQEQLGRAIMEPSQFGQNLTVGGLSDDEVRIGDRFRLGTAVVTVAQPRIPCAKLGARMGDPTFPNSFLLTGKLGYYLYVEEPGTLQQGDNMELLEAASHEVTVTSLWRTVFTPAHEVSIAKQAIDFPHLDNGWKKRLRAILKSA
jgi:MOSC domain-containing protein YiiM